MSSYDWNGLFARAWRRHRLTKKDVLKLTPAEYHCFEKDWLDEVQTTDLMFAIQTSSICNMLKGKKGKTFKPRDFQLFRKKKTTKDFKAILDMATAMTKQREIQKKRNGR